MYGEVESRGKKRNKAATLKSNGRVSSESRRLNRNQWRLTRVILILLLHLACLTPSIAGDWSSSGPYGGSFQAFAFHPTDPELIFASAFEGLFRSTDTGAAWHRLNISGGEHIVRIHPKNPGTIITAGSTKGIYASTDRGEHWQAISEYPFTEDAFYDMEYHPQEPNVIYAVSYYNGFYKSIDGGRSWAAKNSGLKWRGPAECCVDLPQLEVSPSNGKLLYVLLPSRIVYKSTDGGEKWAPANHGLKFTREAHALTMDPQNTMVLYAGGANGIFRTLNGGKEWISRACECYIWSFAVNPKDPREVFGVGEGALKSKDSGKSWQWFSPHPFLSGILLGVAVHPLKPEFIFIGGFGGGIFRSTNSGRNWETVNQELDALNVLRVASDPSAAGRFFAVGGQQAFETKDGGKSWDLFLKGQTSAFWISDIGVHPKNPKLIVAAGFRKTAGALSISSNGGKTWEVRSPYSGVNYGCSRCFAFDPENPRILYIAPFHKDKDKTTQLGIARSTNEGKSWSLINSGLDDQRDIWMIVVNPRQTEQIFAGTGSGMLFRSDNSGKKWIKIGKGLDHTSIRDLTFDVKDPSVLYLSTYSKIFRSNDNGDSWEPIDSGLPQGWFNAVMQDPSNPGLLYVMGERGIFESKDSGNTWNRFKGGVPGNFAVWTLLRDPNQPDSFLAGTDRGVFVYNDSDVQSSSILKWMRHNSK